MPYDEQPRAVGPVHERTNRVVLDDVPLHRKIGVGHRQRVQLGPEHIGTLRGEDHRILRASSRSWSARTSTTLPHGQSARGGAEPARSAMSSNPLSQGLGLGDRRLLRRDVHQVQRRAPCRREVGSPGDGVAAQSDRSTPTTTGPASVRAMSMRGALRVRTAASPLRELPIGAPRHRGLGPQRAGPTDPALRTGHPRASPGPVPNMIDSEPAPTLMVGTWVDARTPPRGRGPYQHDLRA